MEITAEQIVEVDTAQDEEEPLPERKDVIIGGKAYKPWHFKPGQSGNPKGRNGGKSMKEWTKELLGKMSDEERMEFLAGMAKVDIWRMAEGNPTEDRNVTVSVPRPILGGTTQEEQTVNTNNEEIGRIGGDTGA